MAVETTAPHVFATAERNVTTSGTAVQLSTASLPVYSVLIVAKTTNQGNIYVGDSGVDKTTEPTNPLAAGGSIELTSHEGYRLNLNRVYLDADQDGEGVWYTYLA